MNPDIAVIEQRLRRAKFEWYWLQLVRWTSIALLGLSGLVLLCGLLIGCGWIHSRRFALVFLASAGGLELAAWLVALGRLLARSPGHAWFARALERADRQLLDRVNTVVFLQGKTEKSTCSASFLNRIAAQARQLMLEASSPSPFSARNALAWFSGLLMAAGTLLLLNGQFALWDRLRSPTVLAVGQGGGGDSLGEPVLTNSVEQKPPWGEVRIIEPGTDLQMTKADTVPLVIEAAANEALKSVWWSCSVNGGQESAHELPKPADPRYASYRPTLRLTELNLSDWDVVTYYAKAETAAGNSYVSEIYFLEIQPSREQMLKLPGGAGGQADQTLNDLSSLIREQQQVVRQTHQQIHTPPAQEQARQSGRTKLAEWEDELTSAARHLQAEMAANRENQPVGDTLDNLVKAQGALGEAGGLLRQDVMDEAQQTERAALADLVAARKGFHKALSEHPGNFTQPKDGGPPLVAGNAEKQLQEMAEFRNETKSAQDFVHQTAEQQKNLAQKAASASVEDYRSLSIPEAELGSNLDSFTGQHPSAFKGNEPTTAAAQQGVKQAAEQLKNQSTAGPQAAQTAGERLDQLEQALQNRSTQQQLADAYRLKKMLDQEIQALQRGTSEETNNSSAQMAGTARTARETIDQLKKTIERVQSKDAFGHALCDALSDEQKAELDQQLATLLDPRDSAQQNQSAAAAKAGLERLSRAFAASQPRSLQSARQGEKLDSAETPTSLADSEIPALLSMDPERLPPAYRARIQNYFQKLSEKSAR